MASLAQQVLINRFQKDHLPKSNNIPIPTNISSDNLFKYADNEAYMVTSNIFDPKDASPPNEWNLRLRYRLSKFSILNSEMEK
tara:strand:+ start:603 stop:851 length:249 start_codon:yes stop_codon:yes gene_type:complete